MLRGRIARLPIDRDTNKRKGYGFISPDGSTNTDEDIFFHATGLQQTTKRFDELTEGDRVEYTVIDGPKGPRAIEIRVL